MVCDVWKEDVQQLHNTKQLKTWSETALIKDPQEKMHALWETDIEEAAIAALPLSQGDKNPMVLRVTDFKTLCPHQWLCGETIEYYLWMVKTRHDTAKKVLIINYYTAGVIMNAKDEVIKRHLMPKVKFDDFDAAVGALNVHCTHWTLVFLNAASKEVSVVDPLGSNEEEQTKTAGERFRRFFQMRHNILSRKDWSNIRWRPKKIRHTNQQDGNSCGVFVMKVILSEFPDVPNYISIDASLEAVTEIRQQMAATILASSGSATQSVCQLCGCKETVENELWIQCDSCLLWTHTKCTDLTQKEVDSVTKDNSPWFCKFCIV